MSKFSLGSVVVNFGTTAVVVGFFAAADGRPCDEAGWPILRELGASGKPRGGKWIADPDACVSKSIRVQVAARRCEVAR